MCVNVGMVRLRLRWNEKALIRMRYEEAMTCVMPFSASIEF